MQMQHQYFRAKANLLLHFWFVLFRLEPLGTLSPELDFFDASDSRDSSSFFRAFKPKKMTIVRINVTLKLLVRSNETPAYSNEVIIEGQLSHHWRKLDEVFLLIPQAMSEDCS